MWLAIYGTALAQRSVPVEESTKGDATSWLLPYAVVLLFVGLGVLSFCRPRAAASGPAPRNTSL